MKIHIHRWKHFVRVNNARYIDHTNYVKAIYRYCDRCKHWQRAHLDSDLFFTDISWHDSNEPVDVSSLLSSEEAAKNAREMEKEREAEDVS